jgi:hypothetical protein
VSAIRAASRAIGIAVGGALVTAACAAGQQAQTANERPTLDGTEGQVGTMLLRGVALQTPLSGPFYPRGSSVPLKVYIVNNGTSPDSLTGISSASFPGGWDIVSSSDASASASASPDTSSSAPASSPSPTQIAAGAATGYGLQDLTPDGKGSSETVLLKNLKSDLYPGTAVKITFSFQKAGSVTLSVPVQLSTSPNTQTLPEKYVPPSG